MSARRTIRTAAPLVTLLAAGACLETPRDLCPEGAAGRPDCPYRLDPVLGQVSVWRDPGCPPARAVPSLRWEHGSWPELADEGDAVGVGEEIVFVPARRPGSVWRLAAGRSPVAHAEMPDLSEVPARHALAPDDDRLYVIGGVDRFYASQRTVRVLDLRSGQWSSLPDLPEPRDGATALVHEGQLHVLGGTPDRFDEGTATHFLYDLRATTGMSWRRAPDMPERRLDAAGARHGSFYFLLGGTLQLSGGVVLAQSTLVLDLVSGAWSTVAPIPGTRRRARAVAQCGKILLLGGIDGAFPGRPLDIVDVFDAPTRTWLPRSLAPMPSGRERFGAVRIGETLVRVGGATADEVAQGASIAPLSWLLPRSDP